MTDYYCNSTIGNDSNDGLSSTDEGGGVGPYFTIHKGLMNATGSGDTITVEAGNYYDEGNTAGLPSFGANTIIIQTSGRVNIRVYETPILGTYVWRPNTGTTGTWRFTGNFHFDLELLGDGAANTNKHFINSINSSVNFEFIECESTGGSGTAKLGITISGDILLDRCYMHNFAGTPFGMISGSSIEIKAGYLNSMVGILFGTNAAGVTLSLKNNTFNDIGIIEQSGTTTYTNVTIKNNIFISSSVSDIIDLSNVTSYDVSNNIVIKNTAPPEPRTAVYYQGIKLGNTLFYDNSYWIDPDFGTAPALNVTSLAISRGVDAGITNAYTRSGGGASTFDSGLPMIGCFAPTSGSKQYISQVDKKNALVGDSFTYGTAATSLPLSYGGLLEDDTDLSEYSWVRMPGDLTRHLGISGAHSDNVHYMSQEFSQSDGPTIVTILGGVNDINAGDNLDQIGNQIKSTLINLIDLGVGRVIYIGTQIEDADQTTPVYTSSITVETDVNTIATGSIKKVSLSQNVILEPGWNTDVTGFYDADDLHFNNNGHAFLAGLLKPVILAAGASAWDQLRWGIGRWDQG